MTRDNQSPTDLELLLGELADASVLHPVELRQLLTAVRLEAEQREVLLQEASAIELDLARQKERPAISLDLLFPEPLALALRRVTEHLPYCDHVVATTYLAGISGLVKLGTSLCGNPYTDFVTPANLYVATVGRSGQKKTPLEKLLVRRPARELIREMAAENSRVMEHWREQCKESKRKDERPPKPVPIHIQIQDYTGEALVALLHELDKRGLSVLVLRDELSGLFGAMNAYRSGKGADEQQLLELFDGHAFTSLRVTAGDRSYERCQVSIYGAIQPGVLRELIKGGDPSGKWARFLFSPLPENTLPLPTVVSHEGVAAVNAAMQSLEVYARRIYTLPAKQYQLDAEGIEAFSAYEHNKQIQAQQARLDAQGALYGKSAGKVLRVALLLHLLHLVVARVEEALEVPATGPAAPRGEWCPPTAPRFRGDPPDRQRSPGGPDDRWIGSDRSSELCGGWCRPAAPWWMLSGSALACARPLAGPQLPSEAPQTQRRAQPAPAQRPTPATAVQALPPSGYRSRGLNPPGRAGGGPDKGRRFWGCCRRGSACGWETAPTPPARTSSPGVPPRRGSTSAPPPAAAGRATAHRCAPPGGGCCGSAPWAALPPPVPPPADRAEPQGGRGCRHQCQRPDNAHPRGPAAPPRRPAPGSWPPSREAAGSGNDGSEKTPAPRFFR